MEAAAFIFYAVTKFLAYCAWCLFALRVVAPAQATLLASLKYGSFRWLLGLGFGVAAGIALGSVSPDSVARLYFSVYDGACRAVEEVGSFASRHGHPHSGVSRVEQSDRALESALTGATSRR